MNTKVEWNVRQARRKESIVWLPRLSADVCNVHRVGMQATGLSAVPMRGKLSTHEAVRTPSGHQREPDDLLAGHQCAQCQITCALAS